jgi:hypothetical protein
MADVIQFPERHDDLTYDQLADLIDQMHEGHMRLIELSQAVVDTCEAGDCPALQALGAYLGAGS